MPKFKIGDYVVTPCTDKGLKLVYKVIGLPEHRLDHIIKTPNKYYLIEWVNYTKQKECQTEDVLSYASSKDVLNAKNGLRKKIANIQKVIDELDLIKVK